MSNHPLDISGLLKANTSDRSSSDKPSAQGSQIHPNSNDSNVRIEGKYWSQLNQESRRMLTSRIWKSVDFNPMLAELDDLSRITEKWLKWAVPTYVNGLKEGPIKEWLNGENREKDFHYVLVGEHLRHLKEIRDQKKAEQKSTETVSEPFVENATPPETEQSSGTPENTEEFKTSIETLDGHIRWFKQYLQERES